MKLNEEISIPSTALAVLILMVIGAISFYDFLATAAVKMLLQFPFL